MIVYAVEQTHDMRHASILINKRRVVPTGTRDYNEF